MHRHLLEAIRRQVRPRLVAQTSAWIDRVGAVDAAAVAAMRATCHSTASTLGDPTPLTAATELGEARLTGAEESLTMLRDAVTSLQREATTLTEATQRAIRTNLQTRRRVHSAEATLECAEDARAW